LGQFLFERGRTNGIEGPRRRWGAIPFARSKKNSPVARWGISFWIEGDGNVIKPEGVESFPLNADNVFSLENRADHRVYFNRPAEIIATLAEEDVQIDKITAR